MEGLSCAPHDAALYLGQDATDLSLVKNLPR